MGNIIGLALIAAIAGGIYACTESDWNKAAEARTAAEKEAAKVPRITARSADGCDVYAFNPGDRWRYFTRCGAQTTTDNSYTATTTSGKTTTTKTVDDSITTERK
jgi:hypothetical protein